MFLTGTHTQKAQGKQGTTAIFWPKSEPAKSGFDNKNGRTNLYIEIFIWGERCRDQMQRSAGIQGLY